MKTVSSARLKFCKAMFLLVSQGVFKTVYTSFTKVHRSLNAVHRFAL